MKDPTIYRTTVGRRDPRVDLRLPKPTKEEYEAIWTNLANDLQLESDADKFSPNNER